MLLLYSLCTRVLAPFVLLLIGGSHLFAQTSVIDPSLKYYDKTYSDNIQAVRLHVNGFPQSHPLLTLGGSARLLLSFDDLSDEVRRYSYKFIHCDQDWQPSNLSELEYNSGFSVDYIDDYDFSLRTLKDFVHYDLVFPNQNMKLERSGNYLLVVYDDEDDRFPVITRRFMVQENLAGVSGRVQRAAAVDKIHTHQEVDLTVNTKQMDLRAPLQELRATVIQNYRWDNAVTNIEPNFLGRESVRFDYQGKVLFEGTNEYRNLDVRSIRAPRTEMANISNEGDRYGMMMLADPLRADLPYSNYFDFNGEFLNMRFDPAVINLADEQLQASFTRLNAAFNGEYIEITWVLNTGTKLEEEVYIFGGLTEYLLKEKFRMVWNPATSMYVGRALVKQGFYNYHYVTVPKGRVNQVIAPLDTPKDYTITEGNYDDTENDYLALIYWRPLGGRYDRLVGSILLNSNGN